MSMQELTPRQQQVLAIISADPTRTLASIAGEIGVTRSRVAQIADTLYRKGAISSTRFDVRRAVQHEQKANAKQAKRARRLMWRKMMFISLRQRLRHMARIEQTGVRQLQDEVTTCQFKGCDRDVRARGFCATHYGALRYTGALWVRRRSRGRCDEPGCGLTLYACGKCKTCYTRWRRHNPLDGNLTAHNTSGYRGVSCVEEGRRWVAYIYDENGRHKNLGSYGSKEMAARAYDTAARKLGKTKHLNFPNETIEVTRESCGGIRKSRSGHKGIVWQSSNNRWQVRLYRDGRSVYIGTFLDLDAAVRAQQAALRGMAQ